MDDADKSDQRIADAVEQAITQARSAPALRPRGRCHFCDECVAGKLLFCEKACSEDFQAEEDAFKRMGRNV
jgi:hypothetical protein